MIGDWMKDPTFLAEAGHALAGCLCVLTCAWFGGIKWAWRGWLAFVAYALLKEYAIDLRVESGENFFSSTVDFVFYMVGTGWGWLLVWGKLATK
jgi:hypothetical protein